jgi:hypothetical protein
MTSPVGKNRRMVSVQATEMAEADVQYVSLVGRGANRIPFRVMKSENGMINLANLFNMKKADVTPKIVAVMTKSELAVELTEQLKGIGFEVTGTTVHKDDSGVVVLSLTSDDLPEDVVVIKMAEDVAAVVSNVQKSFSSWAESNDFAANVSQSGFFPGLRVGQEVLNETIANIMYAAEKGESPTQTVAKALSDFNGYVLSLLSEVPAQAFKMEGIVLKGLLNSDVEGQKSNPDEASLAAAEAAGKEVTAEAAPEGEAAKSDGKDVVDPALADEKAPAAVKAEDKAPAKKEESEGKAAPAAEPEDNEMTLKMDQLLGAMGAMTAQVTGLAQKLDTVEETTTALKAQVAEVESVAKSASEAVSGTVISDMLGDNLTTNTRKGEDAFDGGLFDTAFQKNIRG